MNHIIDPQICGWDTASFFIFSENVFGNFIYYSHLLPAIAGFVISIFVFSQNPKNLASRTLLFMMTCFGIWSFLDLILWATEKPDYTMFVWSIMIFFDLLIYVGSLYFLYAFIENRYPSWKIDVLCFVLFIPLILFAHTNLNLLGFDYTNCYREALEGPLWYYTYFAEVFITFLIGFFATKSWFQAKDKDKRNQILLSTLGVLFLLLSFSIGNIAGSLEINWELGQYGLFGMLIFVCFLTYLIVRYQSLNTKLVSTEALITGILILLISILFIREIENVRIITIITFFLVAILSFFLVRSVKREIAARERNEELVKELAKANVRLRELDRQKSEFVSIASHQLRSPLTSIRGYASMLLDGSYGKITKKAEEALGRIQESSSFMALSIEDFLNVSRIEQGRMKYECSEINVVEMASEVVDEMRATALKKGLVLSFRSKCTGKGFANVDPGKIRQVLYNLIDNSLKYTTEGATTVVAEDDLSTKLLTISITDTGIGMSEETIESLFDKFVRAKNANNINVSGTGLGLYVAKQLMRAMHGEVTATSPGEGKGSTFIVTIPLVS